mmetsp:Transcript_2212/g.4698  ORF Transcript_2212/g.4698 Transcript_2212/m.4698 type:complete len:623 (+) Transcript_2212:106-1974(+)
MSFVRNSFGLGIPTESTDDSAVSPLEMHQEEKIVKWLGVRLQQDRMHFEEQVLELTTLLQKQHAAVLSDIEQRLQATAVEMPPLPAEVIPPPIASACPPPLDQHRNKAWDNALAHSFSKPMTETTPVAELQKHAGPEASSNGGKVKRGRSKFKKVEEKETALLKFVQSMGFEVVTGSLIVANTLLLALEIQYHGLDNGYMLQVARYDTQADKAWPGAEPVFRAGEYIFAVIFIVELALRVIASPGLAVRSAFIWMDGLLVSVSIFDIFQTLLSEGKSEFFLNATMMRVVRLVRIVRVLKMVRAVRAFDSLYLLLRSIQASFGALVWSFLFLLFVQIAAGMFMSQMVRGYIEDGKTADQVSADLLQDNPSITSSDLSDEMDRILAGRKEVFLYFGTFSRTMVTMFEVTLANWAPSCRTLMDNVNEWYGLFYLIYRCMFCFAVLKVIAAVFINETNRVASNDDEIAIMRDRKSTAVYTVKLQEVFAELDVTGDGEVEWAELEAALSNKNMQAWLKSLDVDAHHLQDLFALIEDGHGKISLADFVEGVTRSKGNAKSIDILLLKRMLLSLEERLSQICPKTPAGAPKLNGSHGSPHQHETSGVVSHYSSLVSGFSQGVTRNFSAT